MISILLPTRKRPNNILRLFESLHDTLSDKQDVEVVVRYDDDDELTQNALPKLLKAWKNITTIQLRRPTNYGVLWHETFAVARGDILMVCGDDIVFRSKGWDDVVRFGFETNPDGIALVFGRDGLHDSLIATHPFIHRKWINTVGYLGGSKSFMKPIDRWLDDTAYRVGRRIFFGDIYTEHMHVTAGKAKDDEIYQTCRDYMPLIYSMSAEEEIEQASEVEALRKTISDFHEKL